MSLTMYQASLPVFTRGLDNLAGILQKAATHCEANKIEPTALTLYRLYPDMFHFAKQIQVACDHARNGAARLAGQEAPKWDNVAPDFEALLQRVRDTQAYLNEFSPEHIDGSEARTVVVKRGETTHTYPGQDYLLQRALPNFFFHITTAYDILRHNGVGLGKRDFIG